MGWKWQCIVMCLMDRWLRASVVRGALSGEGYKHGKGPFVIYIKNRPVDAIGTPFALY